MEVVIKDEVDKGENHLTSAAAFVEGGIQEACDDSCSICLEAFCDNDPSTVTSCKHEFHLQCILEWCQRSSNCPMCWQPISLKDPSSQELLEAVEQERNIRSTPARNATIFHHPTLGDFELQHLPVGVNDTELEERIIQHLAAAAAMGRSHHVARRGSRTRSSAHGRPEFLMFSTHANAPSSSPVSGPLPPIEDNNNNSSSRPFNDDSLEYMPPHFSSVQNNQLSGSSSGSLNTQRSLPAQATSQDQDQPGPSDLQSISDTWKSRFNSMSTKYKESIAKSTKGWKEKLFSRSTSMAEIGSEVRREMNAGLASVSRMMERLETRDNNNNNNNNIAGPGPGPQNNVVEPSITEQRNGDDIDNNHDENSRNNDNSSVISTTSSVSR